MRVHVADQLRVWPVTQLMCVLVLVWAASGLASDHECEAKRVAIILSNSTYRMAKTYEFARDEFERHGYEVEAFTPSNLTDRRLNELVATGCTDFLAIGKTAAEVMKNRLPANVRLAYCQVNHPERKGLLERPGTRGVGREIPLGDQFSLITQAFPDATKIGMIYDSENTASLRVLAATYKHLPQGIQLIAVDIRDHDDNLPDAVRAVVAKSPDVFWANQYHIYFSDLKIRAILLPTIRSRVPVFGFSIHFVRSGAIFGAGITPKIHGKQVARLVMSSSRDEQAEADEKLLLPDYEIGLNLKAAATIQRSVSDAYRERATVIID